MERISQNATAHGWIVGSVMPLDRSIKKHGGGNVLPVRLVNLCQPQHATRILEDDDSRIVSTMMPCTIAVYEKHDGKVYVGTMNAGLLGRLFGGVVADVMGHAVDQEQRSFIAFAQ